MAKIISSGIEKALGGGGGRGGGGKKRKEVTSGKKVSLGAHGELTTPILLRLKQRGTVMLSAVCPQGEPAEGLGRAQIHPKDKVES